MAEDKTCATNLPLETRVVDLIAQLKLETRVEVLIERVKRAEEKSESDRRRLEEKFDLKIQQISEGFLSRDKALDLQASANKERFDALNHEAERILKATEVTVSRDTWDEATKADQAWKRSIEKQIQEGVTREEFKSGQSRGVGMSAAVVVQVLTLVGLAAGVLISLLRH